MPNPFLLSILTLITTLAITPTIANTNLNTPNKTTTIVGPNLQANTNNGQININSQNLNILSSQDTNNTKSSTNHENLNVSYTLYGTNSSNLSGSISRDSSTSNSQQTTHHNASLTAANINLNTKFKKQLNQKTPLPTTQIFNKTILT